MTRRKLPSPETSSTGVDSSACLLVRGGKDFALRRRSFVSNLGARERLRLHTHRRLPFAFGARALSCESARGVPSRLAPARVSHSTSREARLRDRHLGGRSRNLRFLPYEQRRTDAPFRALDPPPREVCDLCPRCEDATRVTPSPRHRFERDQRPSEEPCPLRHSLRPISRPSLSRSSTCSVGSRDEREPGCKRARRVAERTGDCPMRDMGRGPEAKVPLGDSRRVLAPPSSTADTPCRLLEGVLTERFSLEEPARPGGRPYLHEDLGLARERLREESAHVVGPGCLEPIVRIGVGGGSPLASVRPASRSRGPRGALRLVERPAPRTSQDARPRVEARSRLNAS